MSVEPLVDHPMKDSGTNEKPGIFYPDHLPEDPSTSINGS
jgi:hypothetical protein